MCPLSALRLMTRGCIGKLHLQGIVVTVFAQLFQTVGLEWNVGIVLQYLII